MYIHKKGHPVIKWFLLGIIGINLILYLISAKAVYSITIGVLSLVVLFLVVRFFRVPQRQSPRDETLILSPADGRVVAIEETTEDEYFKDKMLQISIFMSIWNVHVNWNPVGGTVEHYQYHPGKYLIAKHPKSSLLNERASVAIRHANGHALMVRQIAGAVARRIITHPTPSQQVQQGDQLGIIKFGSRVDVFLPLDVQLKVNLKDRVKGSVSILASWR